jgi:hypothetical protein
MQYKQQANPLLSMHYYTPLVISENDKNKEIAVLSQRNLTLKVPKREIFDRSDFPDFYTIKSVRVGDFGVKIKRIYKNI